MIVPQYCYLNIIGHFYFYYVKVINVFTDLLITENQWKTEKILLNVVKSWAYRQHIILNFGD